MVTDKKRILLYGVLTAALVIYMAYLLFPPQRKLFYIIDDDHFTEAQPQGTWSNMTCPQCGSQLEQIVIDPADPQKCDDSWRFAYYCREEDLFWVADMPGIFFAGWYGPFDAHLRLTNAIAIFILISSGAALVLLFIGDKGLSKRLKMFKEKLEVE